MVPPALIRAFDAVEAALGRSLARLPDRLQRLLAGGRPVEIDGQVLAADLQLLLAVRRLLGEHPMTGDDLPTLRRLFRRDTVLHQGPLAEVREVRALEVDGAAGPLRARHYRPDVEGGPLPLLVFFHGGGFVLGDLDTHEAPCRALCAGAGVQVLAVDYRLAPEHPFPAAIEDARAALRWAFAHAHTLGADPERIAVGGDSAGGNLAAAVSLMAARDGGPAPALQLLLYPALDRVTPYRSLELFAEGFILSHADIGWFDTQYNQASHAGARDPRLAPICAPDLSGLPRALVITAAFDPLRDEAEAYAAALTRAGNPVVLRRIGGVVHGFIALAGVSRTCREALAQTAQLLRDELGATAR